jgi:hypothetical protein
MSTPPPDWHPDSNRPAGPQSAETLGHPAVAATQFADYKAAASTAASQFAPPPDPTVGAAAWSSVPGRRTLIQANSTTFTAIGVVALYLVLAASTGIVLVGIFPAMLAFRAFQRREPLAVFAIAAAAVAIVFSITVLVHH